MNMSGMEMSGMDMGTGTSSTMMHMSGMDMAGTTTTSSGGTVMDMATTAAVMSMSGMEMSGATPTKSMTMSGMSGMNMGGTATMSMAMGGMTGSASSAAPMEMKMTCTMSMLWNWYSKDVCFISSQWKTSTKALFGGTCVGVFALLITINWWRRILFQYKIYCAELREKEVVQLLRTGVALKQIQEPYRNTDFTQSNNMFVEWMIPFTETWKHHWFWALNQNLAVEVGDQVYLYPSIFEHIVFCVGDTMEWSVHHVIMLLFMYFNGYVFISCMIGAGTGFLLWQYKNINVAKRGDNVSKRCCL